MRGSRQSGTLMTGAALATKHFAKLPYVAHFWMSVCVTKLFIVSVIGGTCVVSALLEKDLEKLWGDP